MQGGQVASERVAGKAGASPIGSHHYVSENPVTTFLSRPRWAA